MRFSRCQQNASADRTEARPRGGEGFVGDGFPEKKAENVARPSRSHV